MSGEYRRQLIRSCPHRHSTRQGLAAVIGWLPAHLGRAAPPRMRQRFALVSQCRPHALRLVEATEEMWREVRAETMAAAVPVGDMVAVAMAAVAMVEATVHMCANIDI